MTSQEYLDKMPDVVFPHETSFPDGTARNFGLTKRELFTAMIAQGMAANLSDPQGWGAPPHLLARQALKFADALIEELKTNK